MLSTLRRHPGVSEALCERAIGDYLLFGMKMDHADTTFAGIRSVPPGHVLTVTDGTRRVAPYWELPPVAEPRRPARPEERVERFRELFDEAVSDRLRGARAGTHLSGGMDSTSIAATAEHVLGSRGGEHELRAYVIVYDKLFAEEEGRYAQLVADRIGVALEHLVADEYLRRPFAGEGDWRFPEPGIAPNQSTEYEISRRVASFARTLLVGFGGDPLLRGAPVRPPAWRRLARRALRRGRTPSFAVPDWIAPDFARRIAPAERWHDVRRTWDGARGARELQHPLWATLFALAHPGACGLPLRDLRVGAAGQPPASASTGAGAADAGETVDVRFGAGHPLAARVRYGDDRASLQFAVDAAGARVWADWSGVVVEPSIASATALLAGPVLGGLLRRRGTTSLHGCAIAIGDGAIVVVGARGAGKSTLAAALAQRGHAVLADDVAALDEHQGGWTVHPGYPRLRLAPQRSRRCASTATRRAMRGRCFPATASATRS